MRNCTARRPATVWLPRAENVTWSRRWRLHGTTSPRRRRRGRAREEHCSRVRRSTQVNEEGRQKKVVGTDPTPGAELRDGSLVLVRQDSSAQFSSRIIKMRFCCSELCKLSMKGGPAEGNEADPAEPISMQSKVLSSNCC